MDNNNFKNFFIEYITIPLYTTLGLQNPYFRSIFFAGTAGLVVYLFKPEIMFTKDGKMRPWIVTTPDDADATVFPFFGSLLFAGTLGVLI